MCVQVGGVAWSAGEAARAELIYRSGGGSAHVLEGTMCVCGGIGQFSAIWIDALV